MHCSISTKPLGGLSLKFALQDILCTKMGQVMSRSFDVIRGIPPADFSSKSCFRLWNLLSLTEADTLCVIQVRKRPHLTFDIVS